MYMYIFIHTIYEYAYVYIYPHNIYTCSNTRYEILHLRYTVQDGWIAQFRV